MLDTTETLIHSALQRARQTIEAAFHPAAVTAPRFPTVRRSAP